jgi:hypothetical protein
MHVDYNIKQQYLSFNFNAIRLHKVVLECVWSAMKNNKGLCCKEGAKFFYELKNY